MKMENSRTYIQDIIISDSGEEDGQHLRRRQLVYTNG